MKGDNLMKRPDFDASELTLAGVYPPVLSGGMIGNPPVYRLGEMPRYNRPITPRDNFKLLLSGEKP